MGKKKQGVELVEVEEELQQEHQEQLEYQEELQQQEQDVKIYLLNNVLLGKTYHKGVHIVSQKEYKSFIENNIDFKLV